MTERKTVTAIILSAGNSTRYGKNRNKNFEIVNNSSILSYSLRAFEKSELIDNIIVAIKESERENVLNIIQNESLKKNIKLVIGGNTRKESVYNCLKSTDSDIVMIHDGARPLIKQKYISDCIASMKYYKGVTVGVKSKDTVKIADSNNIVVNTTIRSNTWLIQTPQCFDRATLLSMHKKYNDIDATDDCMLLEKDNYPIKIINGDYTNIKLTTPEDLNIIIKFVAEDNN